MNYIDSTIKFTPPYPRTSPAFKLIWAQFVITASDVEIKDFGATFTNLCDFGALKNLLSVFSRWPTLVSKEPLDFSIYDIDLETGGRGPEMISW